jgi:hypothetical protein
VTPENQVFFRKASMEMILPASAGGSSTLSTLSTGTSGTLPLAGALDLARDGMQLGAATAGFRRRRRVIGALLDADVLHFEFQAKLHGRVDETGDGVEGNEQALRHIAERQADLEAALAHRQIPELVLENDGHFLRIFLAHALRQANARRFGPECDEEMMVAGEPFARGFTQNFADHAAQGILHE